MKLQKLKQPLSVFIIFILTCLAYSNSFSVPFHFDDFGYAIGLNSPFEGLSTVLKHLSEYTFRSLALTTFSIQKANLQFENLFWWHLPNFLVHLGTGVLLYFLLVYFVGMSSSRKDSEFLKLISIFLVGIYLLHPINIQSVTYLSQRFSSMAGLFVLASLWAYVKYVESGRNGRFLWLAIGFGLLGNLCKESAAVVGVLWIALELTVYSKNMRNFKTWIGIGSMLLIPVMIFLVGGNKSTIDLSDDTTPLWWQYLATQSNVIFLYLKLWVWPSDLNVDHQPDVITSLLNPKALVFGSMILLLLAGAWMLRKTLPVVSFGIFMFFICLAPDSSILPLPDYMYEHRMYVASGALVILLGIGVVKIRELYRVSPKILIAALATLCCVLSFLTFQRNKVWATELTLWEDCLSKSPENIRAHMRLGKYYFDRNELEKSLEYFEGLSAARPEFYSAWTNIGVIHAIHKNYADSIAAFRRVLELSPEIETHHDNLAKVLAEANRIGEAREHLQKCIETFGDKGPCQSRLNRILTPE